jgi:cyclase
VLKVRIIPTMLWKGLGLVKGVKFDSWRRTGSVLQTIKVYNARDVDELFFVDISASLNEQPPDSESIADFSDECSVPLTVGGGITSSQQITKLLRAGADKVSVNTAFYRMPNLINEAATLFGAQCVVASIDVKRHTDGSYTCFSHSGTVDTRRNPVEWACEVADRGAGEILLTSIDRDGTMSGYDLTLVKMITSAVSVPVIASGGAGSYQDLIDAITVAGASAVAAASIFHFTELTPAGAKQALQMAGVPVRRKFVAT